MNSTENQIEINVGVDVGKSKLDIVLHPLDLHFSIPNDQEHISKVIQVLKTHRVKRIVTEATGRYEHVFVFACDKADLPVVVVNPIQVRRYAQAIGVLAKTDKIDASVIARFAATIFKQQYEHLKASGKLPKVALIACMRKMIVILNTMIKNEELWREKTA